MDSVYIVEWKNWDDNWEILKVFNSEQSAINHVYAEIQSKWAGIEYDIKKWNVVNDLVSIWEVWIIITSSNKIEQDVYRISKYAIVREDDEKK